MTPAKPEAPGPARAPLTRAERWKVAFAGLAFAALPWLGVADNPETLRILGPWVLLGASAALGGVGAYGSVKAIRALHRTGRAFDAEARRRGWTHVANDQGAALGIVQGSPAFQGSLLPPRLPHVLYGQRDGVPFFVAQVHWPKRRHETEHVAVGIAMPRDGDLLVERETGGHRLKEAFGTEEVDFESAEFSRLFWVRAADRRFAYAVLHPKAMDFLLRRGPKATWSWSGRWLVVSWSGSFEAQESLRFAREAWDFRALLPRHLLAWERMPDPPARPAPPAPPPARSR